MNYAIVSLLLLIFSLALVAIGYALAPRVLIEDVDRVPSFARYEGPYNIAGTSSYEWIITVKYQFTDQKEASAFYRELSTWEKINNR